MELANYKACICEGSAENAIMDILLDYNLLIFNREEMIEEEVIRCREAKKFEEKSPLPWRGLINLLNRFEMAHSA